MATTRGQHLIGKEIGSCVLEKLLGYGGSSAVFLAQDRSSGEKVAVKVFLPRSTMDAQSRKNFYRRFLREAEAASELDHPNILSIYAYGEHNGLPYIVMPYMPGGTLSEYVARHGPLSLSEAQYYLEEIASALDYAHEHGCIHCDVKPANILLDETGHALLTDFGIAHLLQTDTPAVQQSMKSPETLMGTPDYISPEQALGQQLDGRSDIYSLGVTLFFLLAGNPPFQAESSIAMALMHVHEPAPLLGLIRSDVTEQIDRILGKALAKWPEERYQTAGEFSKAFAEAVVRAAHPDQVAFTDLPAGVHAPGGSNGGAKAPPALRPIVRIKPLAKRSFQFSRIVVAVSLLLLIIIGSVTAAIIVNVRSSLQPRVHAPPTSKKLDLLVDDQDDWPWPKGNDTFFFDSNGRYHIRNTSRQTLALAFYGTYVFTNFRLTVTATQMVGTHNDYYGIVLRAAADESHYYLFEVSASEGGQYAFWRFDGQWHWLAGGGVPSFNVKLGQRNILTVEARRNTFTLFISGKSLGKPVPDPFSHPYLSGEVGLCVDAKNSEVAFSNLQIDKL